MVNIIHYATVHTKYDTFCVTLVIHILFQGKGISVEPRTPKGIIEWLNLKHTFLLASIKARSSPIEEGKLS